MGIGSGVETMTLDPMKIDDTAINPAIFSHAAARSCLLPMGITSENVAAKYGVSRAAQDALAAESHARAAAARKAGRFRDEIVPVRTRVKDDKTGEWTEARSRTPVFPKFKLKINSRCAPRLYLRGPLLSPAPTSSPVYA